MTRKFIRAVAAILAVLCMAAAVSSCGDTTTEPASPSSSVSKQTESTETPGADGKIFEIQPSEDMTVEVEGNTYNIYVPNEQTVLQLHKYVKVGRGISWRLADDVSMKSDSLIPSKTVSLKEGVNIFYVNCQNETESVMEDYTIIIHRAGMYTVRFEGLTETQSVLEGGYAKAPAGIPKKEGYNFESWDFDFSKRITADTEISAKWVPAAYTVTYDANLGTVSPATQSVTFGESVTLAVPKREGYTFAGWRIKNSDPEVLVSDGAWILTSDVTLEARWVNRDFTVTFDPNGGTIDGEGGIAVKQAKYGEKIEFPVPIRPGYSFGGWFNGDMLCEDGVFQYVQDLNLVARWNENSTTVTFVENGGSNGSYNANIPYGGVLPTPTREGFTFGGWFYDENLTDEAKVGPSSEKPVRLYAWWEEEGKPSEFVYQLDGLSYRVTDRVDRNSTSMVPQYIGGLKTVDEVPKPNPDAGITLEKNFYSVKVDRTVSIVATLIPRYNDEPLTLLYSSSNDNIASVDENGVITGHTANAGTCTITLLHPASGMTATCHVTVIAAAKNPEAGLTLAEKELNLNKGESQSLTVSLIPEYDDDDTTLAFESDNRSVATVDQEGSVTAVAAGECRITIRDAAGHLEPVTCTVRVTDREPNENPGITLSQDLIQLMVGGKKTVTATFVPEFEGDDTTLVWESDQKDVATVVNGEISAVSEGECLVTVSSADKKYSATVTVSVKEAGIHVDEADLTLKKGETGKIVAHLVQEDGTVSSALKFKSEAESIATVDDEGNIQALEEGTCVLVVSSEDGKYEKKLTLKVESAESPATEGSV